MLFILFKHSIIFLLAFVLFLFFNKGENSFFIFLVLIGILMTSIRECFEKRTIFYELRHNGWKIPWKTFWLKVPNIESASNYSPEDLLYIREPIPQRDEMAVTFVWDSSKSDLDNLNEVSEIYSRRFYVSYDEPPPSKMGSAKNYSIPAALYFIFAFVIFSCFFFTYPKTSLIIISFIALFAFNNLRNQHELRKKGYRLPRNHWYKSLYVWRGSKRTPLPSREEISITPIWNDQLSDKENLQEVRYLLAKRNKPTKGES